MRTATRNIAETDSLGTRPLSQRERWVLGVASIAGILCLWQLATGLGWINPVLLPSPFDIGRAFVVSLADGTLLHNVMASFARVVEDRKSVV